MFKDLEEVTRRLGFATSHRIFQGEVTGVVPVKKRQKGFRGFHNDAPKFCKLTQECVLVDPLNAELLDLFNVRTEKGVPTAECRYRGRQRKVQKQLIQNPNVNEFLEFKGIGRIWRFVD